jgi:AcrR family transcriptional regulator
MPHGERVNRSAVVQTAADLADALGDLNRLTLAEVAAKLGIRIPSLYNHVDGLAGLRREVALLGLRELTEAIQSSAVGRAGDTAITAIAHAYRDYATRYPGRYGATLEAPEPGDEALSAAAQKLLLLLLRVFEAYDLSGTDTVHIVRSLRSVLHGFVTLEKLGGFKMAVDLDESFERLIKLFLAGLHHYQTGT